MSLKILPLNLELDFNTNNILNLISGEVSVKFRDKLDSPDGKQYHIQSVFSVDGLMIRLSLETAPAFLKIFNR